MEPKDTKREPKAAKMEQTALKLFVKVCQKAIKKKKNDVQKRSVPGHPKPLELLGTDRVLFFFKINVDKLFRYLFGSQQRLTI